MALEKRYFPTQTDDEQIFLLLRRHWFAYLPMLGIGIFMSFPLFAVGYYCMINYDQMDTLVFQTLIVLAGSYALFVLGLLLFGFIDYYLDVDIVTNKRVVDIEQNGFFNRKISELSIDQVEDVTAIVVGFFPTMMHYGDVHIQTAGSRPNFTFLNIPNPYRISKKIMNLHDAVLILDKTPKTPAITLKAGDDGVLRMEGDTNLQLPKNKVKEIAILSGIDQDKKRAEEGKGVALYDFSGAENEGKTIKIGEE